MARLFARLRVSTRLTFVLILTLSTFGQFVEAADERYDYDPLGRLIRAVDTASQVTEYDYDAVGNITAVRRAGEVQSPSVQAVAPTVVRRGQSARVIVSGSNLGGASVLAPSAALLVSGVQVSAGEVAFDLLPSLNAPLGPQTFAITSAAGSASFELRIDPVLPVMAILPGPVAVPPDGTPRNFLLTLSSPDAIDHHIALTVSNPVVATVSPDSVIVPAGVTEVPIQVAGLQAGLAGIVLAAPEMQDTSVPVFVTGEFTGLTTGYARAVGVVWGAPEEESEPSTETASTVGVVLGSHIESLSPQAFIVGTGPHTLTIKGSGLGGATGVAVIPSDGIETGTLEVAPDGASLTVSVTIAAEAQQTRRRVVVSGPGGSYPYANAADDGILIVAPPPEIDSIEPIFALPGSPHVLLTIRGRHFQRTQSVAMAPGQGITVGTGPVISADGTVLTVAVAVSPLAPPGEHVVTVTTPAGTSATESSAANTFRVAEESHAVYDPILSPQLGVTLTGETASALRSQRSPLLGVALGPIVTSTAPRTAVIGESTRVTLQGRSLTGAAGIEVYPDNGLLVGEPDVAVDGESLAFDLEVAAEAPLGPRRLRVRNAGGAMIPFADPAQARLNITLPVPELDSISPIVLQQGQTGVTLTVRGRNLGGASQVSFLPEAGLVAAPPAVNDAGTQAQFNVSVEPDAEPGERVVMVTTGAGSSSAEPSPANTLQVVSSTGGDISPVVAPVLGLLVEAAGSDSSVGPILAPQLAVELLSGAEPPPVTLLVRAPHLGVAVGSLVTAIEVPFLLPGAEDTVVVSGVGLDDVDAVVAVPAAGIGFGTPEVSAEGDELTVAISVASDAAPGVGRLAVLRGGMSVPVHPAVATLFRLVGSAPAMDSISPILGYQGDTVALIIRGSGLHHARVTAEPAEGISIDASPVPNAEGTELTLRIGIGPEAPIGSRVIRVDTPGGITGAEALPANTFTVYPAADL